MRVAGPHCVDFTFEYRTQLTLGCVADLLETATDPLVRAIRRILRKRNVARGIACVLSEEVPQKTLKAIADDVEAPHELAVLPNFRVVTQRFFRCLCFVI